MPVDDQIALLTQRVGGDRFDRLLSGLDRAATRGDAERLLRASEFFRALFERQIDWLELEADLPKAPFQCCSQTSMHVLIQQARKRL